MLGFAIGGVAVGAVLLTALVTIGLTRVTANQRALREVGREADSVAELAASLPCPAGRLRPVQVQRELGRGARFVPDTARSGPDGTPSGRFAGLEAPEGRVDAGGRESLYAARRATLCGETGTLYLLRPVQEVQPLPEGFVGRLALAALAALAGSLAVAYVLARRLSKPLGQLASSARVLARGVQGAALSPVPSDPAEVAEVRDAFDGMAQDLASAREREKSFLLSVSHELRTPLTAIRGYGEALADGTARGARKAGEVVVRESRRLERLVQDLIDLARLEAGEFSVDAVDVDLAQVASSVVEALRPASREAGVKLAVRVDGPLIARTDPDRVHQMVGNLVENAMRVTPEGGSVTVEVSDGVLGVRDSGPGLEPEDLARAFERFYLWRKYRGDRPVGSGLGLAIVGELAQRLGVKVGVRSAPGEGSLFELRFDP